jgi:hypothetical protein
MSLSQMPRLSLVGQREVRTAKGVAFFHEPIGTPITDAEYQGILAARREARAKHAAGHPERLAAERAVRQARKVRKASGIPDEEETPQPKAPEPVPQPTAPVIPTPFPKVEAPVPPKATGELKFTEKGDDDFSFYTATGSSDKYRIMPAGRRKFELRIMTQSSNDPNRYYQVREETFPNKNQAIKVATAYEGVKDYESEDDRYLQAIHSLSPDSDTLRKELADDPRFAMPDEGYKIEALNKRVEPLSFHPTAPTPIPRYVDSHDALRKFLRFPQIAYTVPEEPGELPQRAAPNVYLVSKISGGKQQPNPEIHRAGTDIGDRSDPVNSISVTSEPDAKVPTYVSDSVNGRVRAGFAKQYAHAPGVIKRIIGVSLTRNFADMNTEGTVMGTTRGAEMIQMRLNPDILPETNAVDKDEPQKKLTIIQNRKWWVRTDHSHSMSDNVVGHETGHGVANSIFQNTLGIPVNRSFYENLVDAIREELGNSISHATLSRPPRTDLTGGDSETLLLVNAWLKSNKAAVRQTISEYASHSARELLAELWNEYTLSSHPRAPARMYGELATRLLKEKGLDT